MRAYNKFQQATAIKNAVAFLFPRQTSVYKTVSSNEKKV